MKSRDGFIVEEGLIQWALLESRSSRVHATIPWIKSFEGRTGNQEVSLMQAAQGKPRLGVRGGIVLAPPTRKTLSIFSLLLEQPRGMPLSSESKTLRDRIRSDAPRETLWFPNATIVYPGNETFLCGSGPDHLAMDLAKGATAWAQAKGAKAVSFLYVDEPRLADCLRELGYFGVPVGLRCVSKQTFSNMSEYLGSLPKSSRSGALREMAGLKQNGIRIATHAVDAVSEDLISLRSTLRRKYGARGPVEHEERATLRRLVKYFGPERLVAYTAHLGDEIISFCLFVLHANTWTAAWTGTSEHPKSRNVHYSVCYYRPMSEAARGGIEYIDYGQGSWRTKVKRGCRVAPLTTWILPIDTTLVPAIAASQDCTRLDPSLLRHR